MVTDARRREVYWARYRDGVRVDGVRGRFGASYLFLGDVHRVVGNHLAMSSHLLNAQYRIPSLGTLTGYAYFLDYDATSVAGLSTTTIGGSSPPAGTRPSRPSVAAPSR